MFLHLFDDGERRLKTFLESGLKISSIKTEREQQKVLYASPGTEVGSFPSNVSWNVYKYGFVSSTHPSFCLVILHGRHIVLLQSHNSLHKIVSQASTVVQEDGCTNSSNARIGNARSGSLPIKDPRWGVGSLYVQEIWWRLSVIITELWSTKTFHLVTVTLLQCT